LLKKDFAKAVRNNKWLQTNTLQQILKTHPDRNFWVEKESHGGLLLFSQNLDVISCQLN
jgi:hypothetical protein